MAGNIAEDGEDGIGIINETDATQSAGKQDQKEGEVRSRKPSAMSWSYRSKRERFLVRTGHSTA